MGSVVALPLRIGVHAADPREVFFSQRTPFEAGFV